MLVVALTGGVGSGKSTVTRLFRKQGVTTIDVDKIAHELSARGAVAYADLCDHFGQGILDKTGEINRKKLRKIVFAEPRERKWLEQLLHPLILDEAAKRVDRADGVYCIIEIPLLAEQGAPEWVNRVLVVDASKAIRINRVAKRDAMPVSGIHAMMQAQTNRKKRLAIADDVIENTGTLDDLAEKVSQLHQYYLHLSH